MVRRKISGMWKMYCGLLKTINNYCNKLQHSDVVDAAGVWMKVEQPG